MSNKLKTAAYTEDKPKRNHEIDLKRWKYLLANDTPAAYRLIERVVEGIHRGGPSSDPHEANRTVSRLKNAVETPFEYGVSF